jgi:hypothetical protein
MIYCKMQTPFFFLFFFFLPVSCIFSLVLHESNCVAAIETQLKEWSSISVRRKKGKKMGGKSGKKVASQPQRETDK